MRSFEELQPSPLLIGNATIGQFNLEIGRQVPGAKEHGHFPERDALVVQFEQTIDDEACLLALVAHGHQPWGFAAGALGPELLGVSLATARDERVGGVEYRGHRPVVSLQRHDVRAGKLMRKVENVSNGRAAKRVDALGIIANHRDASVRAERAQDARLERVRILVLVHQHMVV